MIKRNFKRKISVFIIVLSAILVLVSSNNTSAVALDPIPTRQTIVETPTNTAYVSIPAEFAEAMTNTSISVIKLENDINTVGVPEYSNTLIDRNLRVDGQGFSLNARTPFRLFQLSHNTSTNRVFELKDINLHHIDNLDNGGVVMVGNNNWDVVFNGVTTSGTGYYQNIVNSANQLGKVYFTGNNNIKSAFQIVNGSRNYIFESNTNTQLSNYTAGYAIFDSSVDAGVGSVYPSYIYFAPNSKATIQTANSTKSGKPMFETGERINVYNGADVTLKSNSSTVSGVDSAVGGPSKTYNIDTGGKLSIINGDGPALYDTATATTNTLTINANPGSTLIVEGNGATVFDFKNSNSSVNLDNPAYFDFKNTNASNKVFDFKTGDNTPYLKITNTEGVNIWKRSLNNNNGPSSNASPIINVNIFAGNDEALVGSSQNIFDAEWKTSDYSRIRYADVPRIDDSDVTLEIGRTHDVGSTITPTGTTAVYVVADNSIASINSNGIITGLKNGETTIKATLTSPSGSVVEYTIKVTVNDGKPVISAPKFTELTMNAPFNNLTGVSATDFPNVNLTSEIRVTGNVNTSVAGIYVLNYSVKDSDLNQATAKQVVLVNDGSYVVGEENILFATNFTKRVGQVDTANSAVINAASAKIYSKSTGLVTSDTEVLVKNLGGYQAAEGKYTIQFAIVAEPTITKNITATVDAGNKPVFVGADYTTVNYNTGFNSKTGVTVNDVEDGNTLLTSRYTVEGNVNTSVPGVYKLKYEVTDTDNNTTIHTRVVTVVKNGEVVSGANYIIQAKAYSIRRGEINTTTVSDASIISRASVKVYDKTTGNEISNPTLVVVKGSPEFKLGVDIGYYPVTFKYSNESTLEVQTLINVTAGAKPTIEGANYTEISVGTSFDPTLGVTYPDAEDINVSPSKAVITGEVKKDIPGIYKLVYSITDSDFNNTTHTRIVVVTSPGSVVAGTNYIIQAQGYEIRKGQVNSTTTSNEKIIETANVKLYNKDTGLEVTNPTYLVSNPSYTVGAALGEHTVKFISVLEPTLNISVKINVTAGQNPVFNITPFIEVRVGETISPVDYGSVSDYEDGSIPVSKWQIATTINYNVPGIYHEFYSVTDTDGNSANAMRVIAVTDPDVLVVGDKYIIKANDYTIRRSAITPLAVSDTTIKSSAGVKVYNKTTGLEISNPNVVVTKIEPAYAVGVLAGNYDIKFSMADDETTKIINQVTVVAGESPVINGAIYTEINKGTAFNDKAGITITDDFDTLTSSDVIVDGSVDINTTGVYVLKYSVTDSDGNNTKVNRVVVVKADNEIVIGTNYIIKANDYSIRKSLVTSQAVSDATIKSSANLKVYNKTTGELLPAPVVTLVKGSPSYNANAPVDRYPITLTYSQDTTATIKIYVNVHAGSKPVLNGVDYKTITVGTAFNPLAGVSVTDPDETIDVSKVSYNGTVNINVAGVYVLKYSVTDSDGNTTEKDRVIAVTKPGEVVAGNNYIIKASSYELRKGQVNEERTSDTGIISDSKVIVYSATTGAIITNPNLTITKSTPEYTTGIGIGEYPLNIKVNEETAVSIDIKAKVISGDKPVINGTDLVVIGIGNSFNPLETIEVTDKEDLIIDNSRVVVNSNVNINVSGVYTINYSVVDSDGNSEQATKVVVVSSNDNTVVGDNYILQANSYEIRKALVTSDAVSDNTIKTTAGVKVYNKTTGIEILNEPVTVTKNDPAYVEGVNAGDYKITFSLENETTLTKQINVKVFKGEAPTINGATFIQVSTGSTFNSLAGIDVTDDYDTISNSSIEITGNVNTMVVGVYPLNYKVTDSDGNITEVNRVVVVGNDNNINVGTNYIISAQPYTLRVGQVTAASTGDTIIKQSAKVKVYDKTTGLLISNEPTTLTKGTGALEYKVGVLGGDYPLTFNVNAETNTKVTTKVTVIEGTIPVINGASYTEINLNSTFNPRLNVTAMDIEDGNITAKIGITGNVTTNIPGVYKLKYTVVDSDQNSYSVDRVVVVNDNESVSVGTKYIIVANSYQLLVSEVTEEAVLDSSIIRDSKLTIYNKETGNIITDITPTITRGTDLEEFVFGVGPGTYPITYTIVGGTVVHTINVEVASGTPPEFRGVDFTIVNKGDTFNQNAGVSVLDAEEGTLDIETNPTYSVTGSVDTTTPGVYTLIYQITDGDGNETRENRIVVVNDPNEISVGDRYIIQAHQYDIRKGQVSAYAVTDEEIIKSAQVMIYNKLTGQAVENSQISVTKLDPTYQVGVGLGSYDLVYTTALENGLSIQSKVNVIPGKKPVITGDAFIEVTKGSTFDLLSKGEINDEEDGVISNNNFVITGDPVNYDGVGIYKVVYTVTDTDGNSSSANRIIAVTEPGKLVVGQNYIIEANNYEIRKSLVDANAVLDTTIINSANVKVYNKSNGLENTTVTKTLTKNNPQYVVGVNAGDYPITYSIAEEPGLTIQNKVTVIKGAAPVINGLTYTEIVKGGSFSPLAGVSVTDDYDIGLNATVLSGSVNTNVAGVYKLVYTVTDSDGNKTDQTRIVVVSAPGELVVGTNYIIQAHDYSLRRGQVTSTAIGTQAIKNSSELKVYTKATGNLVLDPVVTLNKDAGYVINAPVGNYLMAYTYTVEPTLQLTIKAIVTNSNPPVINGATSTSISVGSTFNDKAGITVTDDFDTLTSANVSVTGVVDVNKAGIYPLTYSVKDSDLNTTTITRIVVVSDPNIIVAGTNYIIKANDYEIRKGQITNETTTDASIISSANVKVYSMTTGLEITNPNIKVEKVAPSYAIGVNAGDYQITYSVNEEPAVSITKKVKVVDGQLPIINGAGLVEILKGVEFDPMNGVNAQDFEDGDGLVVSVTGTVDTSTVGVYKLEYSVTDSDRNTTKVERIVVVSTDESVAVGQKYILIAFGYDIRKGTITNDSVTDDTIKTTSNVKVYNTTTGEEVLNPNITIVKNNPEYTTDSQVGQHPISISVNEETTTNVEIIVNVTGSNKPIINGAGFAEVSKNGSFDAMAGITVTDDFDTGLTASILSGSVDTSKPGIYKVVYTVTDSDGNVTVVSRIVAVSSPNELVVGNRYIMMGNGYSIYRRQVDATAIMDATIITTSEIKLYDKATGALVSNPRLAISKGGYIVDAPVGTYPINNTTRLETGLTLVTNIEVLGGTPPEFVGVEFANVVAGTSFDPLNGVSVTDEEDILIANSKIDITGNVDTTTPGIYHLTYTVKDSDSNTITKDRVVVVSKENELVVGNDYIIKAEDYSLRTGQVTTSATTDANIISSGKVVVYDKLGQVVTNPNINVIKETGALEYKPGVNAGVYPITFTLANETTLSINIRVNVDAGQAPVISGAELKTIAVGTTFNKLDDVSITDDFDTLTTTDITVTGNVDINTEGVYPLTYTVTDSDRNTTTITRVIIVSNDNHIVTGDKYIISANSYEIRKGQVTAANTTDAIIISSSNVKVYDKFTGLIINNPGITVERLNPQYVTGVGVGKYKIKFSVASDTTTNITEEVTVVAGTSPVINGATYKEVALGSGFNDKDGITISDDFDTLTANDVIVSGSVNTSVIGPYPLTYTVTDSDGNKTTVKRVVVVTSPNEIVVGDTFIIQANDYRIRKSLVNNEALVDLTIVRNAGVKVYNKETGLEVESLQGSVTKGTPEFKVGVEAGDYPITYTYAYDSKATITKKVTVFAGDAPVINGATYKEVPSGASFDPRTGVTVSDDFDNYTAANVRVTGTVVTSKPGVYNLNYSITDSDGNTTSINRVVVVTNSNSVVVGTNYIIEAASYSKYRGQVNTTATSDSGIMSDGKVKVYDKNTGQLVTKAVTIEKLTPAYNTGIDAGVYPIKLTVAEDTNATIRINVVVSNGESPKYNELPLLVIEQNSVYDPRAGLIVTDKEDGTINNATVTITNPVDTTKAGVYTVNYSVTDTDFNTTIAKRVVVVNDNKTINVGNLYIIEANDYTIRKGQLNDTKVSDGQIIIDSNLKVYDAITGAKLANNVTVSRNEPQLNKDSNLGEYEIVFTTNDETGLSGLIKVTVIAGNVPEFSGVDFNQVSKGSSFDPLAGVSATDDEDGNVTSKIEIISGSVDTSKPGVYKLVYSVSDSDNNTTTKTRIIVVADDSISVGTTYIIQAFDYDIRKGQVTTTSTSANNIITSANVKVYSKATGEHLDGEKVVYTPSTGALEYKVGVGLGQYTVNFSPEAESTLTTSSKVNVISGDAPTFNGLDATYVVKGQAFDPLKDVSVSDKEDITIPSTSINVNDIVDENVVDSYVLVYKVTDSDGNKTTKSRVVFVINEDEKITLDNNIAVIAKGYEIRKGQVNNNEVLDSTIISKTNVKVYSSVDGQLDTNNTLKVIKASPVYQVGVPVGKYPIIISATPNTRASQTISVKVYIDVVTGDKPVISTPSFNTVLENSTFDILSQTSVTDTEDTTISNSSITYVITKDDKVVDKVDTSIPGIYYIKYSVVDSDGNTSEATRIVVVYQDGKLVETTDYVLFAQGYTINKKDLNNTTISRDSILEKSRAVLYNKNTLKIEDLSNIKLDFVNEQLKTTSDIGPYIYKLTTNLDTNLTQNIVINVVDDKTDTSSNIYMSANGFTISVSQFNQMNRNDYYKFSNAISWDSKTGEVLYLDVDYSKLKGVSGVYDLVFTNVNGDKYIVQVTITDSLPKTGIDMNAEILVVIVTILGLSIVLNRKDY